MFNWQRRQLNDLYSAMKPELQYVSDLFNDLKEWISEFWKDTSMKIETVLEI